ncbi:tautomerase [Streptomyces minutiscleroticus]|uniref:Tautomerase n=1 Tax=Streptomyces minutiscleroticus TaxID=68238 RepID=A0A918UB50_9ACTN|nr:tautomerase family protein [Streptomyces minutiscleroticus]GGY20055.1 tautomerase [Streptomyces minutiscleroticus]
MIAMPLVRIDVLRMQPSQLDAVGDAVQQALTESMGFPSEDRFQILTNHDGATGTLRHGTYLNVPRDDGVVYIDITMRGGRTDEQKRQMYAQICRRLTDQAQVAPHNVFIVLHENREADWSFGYGKAQYL